MYLSVTSTRPVFVFTWHRTPNPDSSLSLARGTLRVNPIQGLQTSFANTLQRTTSMSSDDPALVLSPRFLPPMYGPLMLSMTMTASYRSARVSVQIPSQMVFHLGFCAYLSSPPHSPCPSHHPPSSPSAPSPCPSHHPPSSSLGSCYVWLT